MGLRWQDWPPQVLAALRKGVVIPAHPLALDAGRKLDTRRQRALTRYYLDAGARRARGRRAHHAVRDPRRRALPAGARARDAQRRRMGASSRRS